MKTYKVALLGVILIGVVSGIIVFWHNSALIAPTPVSPIIPSEGGIQSLGFTTNSEVDAVKKTNETISDPLISEEVGYTEGSEKYSTSEHGVKITVDSSSFEGNSYVYKDTIVGYDDMENEVQLYLKKNGKKTIIENNIGPVEPEPFEIFQVDKETSLPNIAKTSSHFGDMGISASSDYFIDTETEQTLEIVQAGGANPGTMSIKTARKDYTISMDIFDGCVQKGGKITGHATLKDLLINDKPLRLFGTTKNLPCGNGEGVFGPIYIFPDIQALSIGKISNDKIKNVSDLNKLYFTVVQRDYSTEAVNEIYPIIWENFYSINLQTGEVNEVSKETVQKNVGYSF